MIDRPQYPRDYALQVAYDQFFFPFKERFPQIKCVIVGSIRREKELVHDIDILVVSKDQDVIKWCADKISDTRLFISEFNLSGSLKEFRCQVWFCIPEEYGPALLKWTGPHGFNKMLASTAKKMGGTLSERGLFLGTPQNRGKRIDENTESSIIFKILSKQWIHPRDRLSPQDYHPYIPRPTWCIEHITKDFCKRDRSIALRERGSLPER